MIRSAKNPGIAYVRLMDFTPCRRTARSYPPSSTSPRSVEHSRHKTRKKGTNDTLYKQVYAQVCYYVTNVRFKNNSTPSYRKAVESDPSYPSRSIRPAGPLGPVPPPEHKRQTLPITPSPQTLPQVSPDPLLGFSDNRELG